MAMSVEHAGAAFRSKQYHDAFCDSCRSTMADTRKMIEAILDASANGTAEVRAVALTKVKEILECPWCFWQANEGRHEPKNFDLIREYLPDWNVASHCHWMHHNFWNRFSDQIEVCSEEGLGTTRQRFTPTTLFGGAV